MNKYYYDLHIHSCLSPCGDDDMTPNNIAGMAALKGLQVAALTDHNTCKNCPAFLDACKKNGIIGIAGMELTTAEEIHMLCLFEELSDAMAFSEEVEGHRFKIKNKPDVFGEQLIMDSEDNIIGNEEYLLINATDLDMYSAVILAGKFNAVICPAHIDKQSNGIIGILGDFPPPPPKFSFVELADSAKVAEYSDKYPVIRDCVKVFNSDAHFLWDINEAEHYVELDDEPYSSAKIRKELLKKLSCLD